MDWIQGLILGLVQGLAEFLPISSSGHLAIGQELFNVGGEESLSFVVTVHCATVLSTIVAFRRPLGGLVAGFFRKGMNREKDYIFKIFVSMIPILIVGFTLNDYVEKIFATDFIKEHTGNPLLVVGIMLVVTAGLLFFSEKFAARQQKGDAAPECAANTESDTEGANNNAGGDNGTDMKECGKAPLNYWQAFVVGVAQACAVLPGLSRSGSTIAAGLLVKVRKSAIAQFSFLMVIIPILGETFLKLLKSLSEASTTVAVESAEVGILPLAAGFLAAFVSGLLACRLMVNLVKRIRLSGFALYCAAAGVLCIVLPYIL